MMDVVGNNISNVNTTGFKSSAIVFEDVLSQQVRGAGQAEVLGDDALRDRQRPCDPLVREARLVLQSIQLADAAHGQATLAKHLTTAADPDDRSRSAGIRT